MTTPSIARPRSHRSISLVRIGTIFAIMALIVIPLFSSSSASSNSDGDKLRSTLSPVPSSEPTAITLPKTSSYREDWQATIADPTDILFNPAIFAAVQEPIVGTYAHDGSGCTSTPKTNFSLGDIVCVKVNNVPANALFPNKISYVDIPGFIEQRTDLTTDSQTDQFQLPATDTSTVNGQTIDNRGIWRVHVTRNNGRILHTALFNVSDPVNPAAHLVVRQFVAGTESSIAAGSNVRFIITLDNKGPDAASTVQLSDPLVANLALVNLAQTSGTPFTCSGRDCSIASMPAGTSAEFLAEFTVDAGASGGTVLANTVLVTSLTPDPDDTVRSATARFTVLNAGNQATCVLECPANITVTANTTQGQDSGAIVTFGSGDPTGDCGTITASPASGSFFAVGTHSVSVSSSQGGGSCSFLVTVVGDNPPTIACPLADITADAGAGNTGTSVTVTPPTATGTNVSVTGIRSDAQLVGEPAIYSPGITDPYPAGTTTITWTATESINGQPGRSASCTQKVIVSAADAPTISCPSDKSFTQTGCDPLTLTAGQIGTPTTSGSGITVEATRGDSLGLTDPYPVGVTVITWTATDNIDRTTSCTQRITVAATGDTEDPIVTAPPNVTVEANSCAGIIVGETTLGTPTATDNCGTANVNRTGVPAGNFFPLGITTLTYTATDGSGRTSTATQTITVTESTPPTITGPVGLSFNTGPDATSCGVFVGDATLGTATANDNCSAVTVSRSGVPAGNIFPVGTTTVTYTATDGSGNTASVVQLVEIRDTTAPVLTPPSDVTAYTGPGAASCDTVISDATLGSASASDNCSGVGAVSRTGVPLGNVFPLGTTVITYTVTDANNNQTSATQNVTVIDNTVPTITAPANVTAYTGAGATSCDVLVSDTTLGSASASDNCSGIGAITRTGVPSGNVFPVGTTVITYSVTDAQGNPASATQSVTVIDNTVPTITAPADKTLYTGAGAASCSVTVANLDATLGTATAGDNCPGVTWARGGGNVFPLGETTVTYTATDAHGNVSLAIQKVTVVDNTPPVVTPPANITVSLPLNSSATSMAVSYPNPATATDNCAGAITFAYSPASGSIFPVGTTLVTVTATDAHNNSASATFTVTVLYNFTGFFSPVNNAPVLNAVNAGRAIPVKFSLSGNKGLNIFASNNPFSTSLNCATNDPGVDIVETLTAGGSSLSYSASSDQYNYVWKTESSWAGTCRQLVVTLNDGSIHVANFKFK